MQPKGHIQQAEVKSNTNAEPGFSDLTWTAKSFNKLTHWELKRELKAVFTYCCTWRWCAGSWGAGAYTHGFFSHGRQIWRMGWFARGTPSPGIVQISACCPSERETWVIQLWSSVPSSQKNVACTNVQNPTQQLISCTFKPWQCIFLLSASLQVIIMVRSILPQVSHTTDGSK